MQNALLEHSAILLTFIKLPFVLKTFVFSISEWPLKTGFIVPVFDPILNKYTCSNKHTQFQLYCNINFRVPIDQMSLVVTKPVFGVSDKARLKPVSSATETSQKIENSVVASLDMIFSNKLITKALNRLRGCAGWSAPLLFANTEDRFSRIHAQMVISSLIWIFYMY